MPSALFADVVALYREDWFMRGTLRIEGQTAAPSSVTMPVLAVVDPESDVVPPSSVIPFLDALPHRNWTLLHYEGDTGVALRHVGVLTGHNAFGTHSALREPLLGLRLYFARVLPSPAPLLSSRTANVDLSVIV
jgi:hypothetical protein